MRIAALLILGDGRSAVSGGGEWEVREAQMGTAVSQHRDRLWSVRRYLTTGMAEVQVDV